MATLSQTILGKVQCEEVRSMGFGALLNIPYCASNHDYKMLSTFDGYSFSNYIRKGAMRRSLIYGVWSFIEYPILCFKS
ncbi:hypothetical protein PIB30_016896 [Stylosanthes scabra]|uniref:Uncharacterized protein n=1 Tax=Stylosanthes scabra TaxID=79078 RepID=A0ABU6V5Q0_9FABA|nr:hypothetical protein [Stylosanthes scabra]